MMGSEKGGQFGEHAAGLVKDRVHNFESEQRHKN